MIDGDPKLNFEEANGKRYAVVTFPMGPAEFVIVRFVDAEDPGETNKSERSRVMEKAKSVAALVGRS